MDAARVTYALGAVLLLLSSTSCGSGAEPSAAPPSPSTASAAPFSFADMGCVPAEAVQDSGRTLVYDFAAPAGASEDDDFAHTYTVECIKMVTRLPDHVHAQMQQTSALQGRQSAEWDVDTDRIPQAQLKTKPMAHARLSASWTYHPDNGLDVIMTIAG